MLAVAYACCVGGCLDYMPKVVILDIVLSFEAFDVLGVICDPI